MALRCATLWACLVASAMAFETPKHKTVVELENPSSCTPDDAKFGGFCEFVPSGQASGLGDRYFLAIPSYKPGTTTVIGSAEVEVTRLEMGHTGDTRFESRSRRAQFNFEGK